MRLPICSSQSAAPYLQLAAVHCPLVWISPGLSSLRSPSSLWRLPRQTTLCVLPVSWQAINIMLQISEQPHALVAQAP